LYGMFATPMAYWIDEQGVVAADVAAGVEPIRQLMAKAAATVECVKSALTHHNKVTFGASART